MKLSHHRVLALAAYDVLGYPEQSPPYPLQTPGCQVSGRLVPGALRSIACNLFARWHFRLGPEDFRSCTEHPAAPSQCCSWSRLTAPLYSSRPAWEKPSSGQQCCSIPQMNPSIHTRPGAAQIGVHLPKGLSLLGATFQQCPRVCGGLGSTRQGLWGVARGWLTLLHFAISSIPLAAFYILHSYILCALTQDHRHTHAAPSALKTLRK